MIFKDLINKLKKVKIEKDINPDLAFELTAAAIDSHMMALDTQYEKLDPEEAFDMVRSMILKQLDGILIDSIMNNNDDGLNMNPDSPMDDPILNSAIQKAMDEYNDRLEKKPNLKKV
jgi:hypothetical protein